MKVLFIATQTNRRTIQKTYSKLIKFLLIAKKLEITTTIKPSFYHGLNQENSRKLHLSFDKYIPTLPQITDEMINNHDAIIIEATIPELDLGIYATKCVQQRKPVLILSQDKDYSPIPNSSLLNNRYLSAVRYDKSIAIPTTKITEFIKKAAKHQLVGRFNLFITEEQRNHINQMAEIKNTTASEYVRSLIEQDILRTQSGS